MGNNKIRSVEEGSIYQSNRCGPFKVLKWENKNKVLVEFLETGYQTYGRGYALSVGWAFDPYARMVANTGYFGEGKYPRGVSLKTPAYAVWNNIMKRCYSPRDAGYSGYGAKGVRVHESWHNFQNFAQWYDDNKIEDGHVDEDILGDGKLYGPDTCCIVPSAVNYAVRKARKNSTGYAAGVHRKDLTSPFIVRCVGRGSNRTYGSYDSMHKAFLAYKEQKECFIKSIAEEEYEKGTIRADVYDSLMRWNVTPY